MPFGLNKRTGRFGKGFRQLLASIVLGCFLGLNNLAVASEQSGSEPDTIPPVMRIQLEISAKGLSVLRANPRKNVRTVLREGNHEFREVGIHLKGSTGSFRPIDDKPCFTLDFRRYVANRSFYGLSKFHLNNSVEDPSYLNEWLGGELFRAAGVPAPKVSWAVVELNGKSLGLYVLKEGFTPTFLAGYFSQTNGVLYDTDWGHDVDQRMRPALGANPEGDQARLVSLAAITRESDLRQRWMHLTEAIDMERFMSFMAMEVMLGHRDGYCLARNNFRLYQDSASGHWIFLPAGMDQLLGRADMPWKPHLDGIVAQGIMETPEGQKQYADRFSTLFTNLFQPETLTNRMRALVRQLRPFLDNNEFGDLEREAGRVYERLVQRQDNLQCQLSQFPPKLLEFKGDIGLLSEWVKVDEPAGGKMELASSPDGIPSWHIHAGAKTSASWRTQVQLEPGRYRLEGRGMTREFQPLPYGKNQGASFRLEGRTDRSNALVGNNEWKSMSVEFEMGRSSELVQFIAEFRASAGDLWLDAKSLRVVRLSEAPPVK